MHGAFALDHPVDAPLRQRFVQMLEQAPPAAEERGGERDLQLVDDAQTQILLVMANRDAFRTTFGGLATTIGASRDIDQFGNQVSLDPKEGRALNLNHLTGVPAVRQITRDDCSIAYAKRRKSVGSDEFLDFLRAFQEQFHPGFR
jgi:hypothetical protein